GGGFAVDQDPHVLISPEADGPFHIHIDRGDVVQGITDVAATGGDVLSYIIDFFVQSNFHGGPFPDHFDLTELGHILGQANHAQVDGGGVVLPVEGVGLIGDVFRPYI